VSLCTSIKMKICTKKGQVIKFNNYYCVLYLNNINTVNTIIYSPHHRSKELSLSGTVYCVPILDHVCNLNMAPILIFCVAILGHVCNRKMVPILVFRVAILDHVCNLDMAPILVF
jgi:hypothetical protein